MHSPKGFKSPSIQLRILYKKILRKTETELIEAGPCSAICLCIWVLTDPPSSPAAPGAPIGPIGPCGPVFPACPGNPADPCTPGTPVCPGRPVYPGIPAIPCKKR